MVMEFVDEIDSTQKELCERVKHGIVKEPYCIVAKSQTNGIGSRQNSWISENGNLYFSFCVKKIHLPNDIKDVSVSIYFSCILKEILNEFGSRVWLKWPNDFYINDKKIGGTITTKINDFFICGIGLNLVNCPTNAAFLDITLSANDIVYAFIDRLKKRISWKQIFSKFLIEFQKSREFTFHNENNELISLKNAILCDDGSILINNKRMYSLR
ncbi:biotin--[acetyl-CoA-carboxylase] ligase [Campylobacter sp. RM11259]|nr:biotin--[acetyl-CoA-carboxylase] ligase [Campylobacter sp. RM11259]